MKPLPMVILLFGLSMPAQPARAMEIPDDFWFEQFSSSSVRRSAYEVEVANIRGLVNISEKKWSEAIKAFDISIALERENPVAYANRGSCHVKLEQYDQAEADFLEVARLLPQFGHMMSSRIVVLGLFSFNRNDPIRCEQHADAALKLERTSVAGLTLRGTCRMMQEKLQPALADLTEALELRPDFYLALYERAITNAMLKRCSEAAQDAEKVRQQKPAEYKELAEGVATICHSDDPKKQRP